MLFLSCVYGIDQVIQWVRGEDLLSRDMEVQINAWKEIKAQIWDTTIEEMFQEVTSTYYKGDMGAVFLYDISHMLTFDNVSCHLEEIKMHDDKNMVKIHVGNNFDLEHIREVHVEYGRKLVEYEGSFFIKTLDLDNKNVTPPFKIVVTEIYYNVSKKVLNSFSYKYELSLKRVNTLDGSMELKLV